MYFLRVLLVDNMNYGVPCQISKPLPIIVIDIQLGYCSVRVQYQYLAGLKVFGCAVQKFSLI